MATFLTLVLWLHIISGFTALLVGLVAMLAKKGGQTHILAGKIYYWAMFLVALSALLRFKPEVRLVFLACIAVFSFYNTFTGKRLIAMKKGMIASPIDWLAAGITVVASLAMLVFGIQTFLQQDTFYGVLFNVFGVFSLILSLGDVLIFAGKITVNAKHWLLNHISRMGGSYIATVTAFLVVNNHDFLPPLVAWIAPGVVGGFIIALVRRKYQ